MIGGKKAGARVAAKNLKGACERAFVARDGEKVCG